MGLDLRSSFETCSDASVDVVPYANVSFTVSAIVKLSVSVVVNVIASGSVKFSCLIVITNCAYCIAFKLFARKVFIFHTA